MREVVRARLRALNRNFYDEHASSFSSTRGAAWAGWRRAVPTSPATVLDLGCGNGRFFQHLQSCPGSEGLALYVGTDSSLALLVAAKQRVRASNAHFVQHDLERDIGSVLSVRFEKVVAFGVLHHIPGENGRAAFLANAARALAPGGRLLVTCWQFGDDPRFAARCDDWQTVGLEPNDVESGDHLLRWGDSGSPSAVRYCHATTPDELERLIVKAGLTLERTFYADGKGGRLNLYAELSSAPSRPGA